MFFHKKDLFVFSVIVLLMVILVGCSNGSAKSSDGESNSSDVIEVNVGSFLPSTHHYAYNVLEPWKELVEEKTEGRVKVNLYHGASLGKGTSVYQDVKGGLYDVGIVTASYFYDTDFFPYSIGNLPFAFQNSTEGAAIMKEFAEKYALKDLEGLMVMDPFATDPYDLFTNKPVQSVDDLKKVKMRVSGKSETEFVKALGGVPVSLEIGDTYEALQKHTVNTTFYTPIGGVALKLYEPAPYITNLNATTTITIPVMNKDFYDKLPDDLKKIFDEEVNPELPKLFTQSFETELEKSHVKLEEGVAKRGEMITIDDKEMERFRAAGKAAWDAWVEDANDKGYPGQEMVDDLIEMIEEAGYPAPY